MEFVKGADYITVKGQRGCFRGPATWEIRFTLAISQGGDAEPLLL